MSTLKSISLMLAIVMLIVVACNKNKNNNQPSANSTNNNNSTGPTPVPMTAQDSSLVADWIFDKEEVYINGSLTNTYPHNDPTNCHLLLHSTEVNVGASTAYRKSVSGLNNCVNLNGQWKITSGKLDLNTGLHTINTLTTNSLVIQLGSLSATEAHIYYLHK